MGRGRRPARQNGDAVKSTAFLLSAGLSLAATAAARWIALRFEFVAPPNAILRDQRGPVPYLGGMGILVGFAAAALIHGPRLETASTWLIAGCGILAFLGLMDDWKSFRPAFKLGAQALAVALSLAVGAWFDPAGGCIRGFTGIAIADAFFSGVFLLTVINAVNFIDVADGLAATVAAVTLFLWGAIPGQTPHADAMLAAAGACAGFLVWNRPPARIYMGDCGSHLLGFLLGAAALSARPAVPVGLWVPAALLWTGVPLFELLFITAVRVRKGLPWWKGSPDHYSVRLKRAGLSAGRIDLLSGAAAAMLWVAAAIFVKGGVSRRAIVIGLCLPALAASWKYLLHWEIEHDVGHHSAAQPK